jgi:hypothetical protein
MNIYKKELDRIQPDEFGASVVVSDSGTKTKYLHLNRESIAEMRLFLDRVEKLIEDPKQMILHAETIGGRITTGIGYDEVTWAALSDEERVSVINEFTPTIVNIYAKPEED